MLNILFQISKDDVSYTAWLKSITQSKANVWLISKPPVAVMEVVMKAKEKNCSHIATCDPALLKLLLELAPSAKLPSLDAYAGSIIKKFGMEFLILPPLSSLATVTYGKFLYERYFSKFYAQHKWLQLPEFKWEVFQPENLFQILATFKAATFISIDIETGDPAERIITCVGFTAVILNPSTGAFRCRTVVVPFDSEYNIAAIRAMCSLSPPKCFQNGKYDNAYLLRWGIPVTNWAFDTLNLMHCWLAELPKDLGFIAGFLLRDWIYWKNEILATDRNDYYAYNAKDCFATAMSFLTLLRELPPYAWTNYLLEFPMVFPCLLSELTGLQRDGAALDKEAARFEASMEKRLHSLRVMTATPAYNPSSPTQTLKLFELLGSKDITSSTPANRDIVRNRHPLNDRIISEIEGYRKDRKLVTSYLTDGYSKTHSQYGMTKSWNGRIFYALNPHGTDTGRLASNASVFWCGWNIQNIPRDRDDIQVKRGIVADEGFLFGEADYSQNEARGTAYISGDTNLIATVDDPATDFHGRNAAAFFGMPYEQIVISSPSKKAADGTVVAWSHKVIDKAIRQLSKNTNHGANYNMGAAVMVATMGIKNVLRAQKLLKLPADWSLKQVTQYMLAQYAATYPVVKGAHYKRIVADVTGKGLLVGDTGWTRKCFGNPATNKRWLNAYVAHPPQSLAAMQLNQAYKKVFYNIALRYPSDFKLGPQIHDSILFQYRKGREDLAFAVKDEMRVPIVVTDTFKIKRTLIVPVDLKGNGVNWADVEPLYEAK